MKKIIYVLIAVAVAAVSCEKEANLIEVVVPGEETTGENPESKPGEYVTVTFSASADAATKVSLGEKDAEGNRTAVWDSDDAISIIWYASEMKKYTSTNIEVDGEDASKATFTFNILAEDVGGFESANYVYALYPATLKCDLNGDEGDSVFKVTFDNNCTYSDFKSAARYAARVSDKANAFVFKPISTVICFKVDDSSVKHVWFRFMETTRQLRGDLAVSFSETGVPTVSSEAKDAAYNSPVSTPGTYYMTLPANNATDSKGFVMRVRGSGSTSWRPAAYYGTVITLTPGKLYNLTNAVESKSIEDYYVAPDDSDEAGNPENADYGTGVSNPAAASWFADNLGVFKYYNTRGAAYILNGATIHLMGSATAFTSPLSTLFPTGNEDSYSYTIEGGEGGRTTTFTTTASSTFPNSKATVALKAITFSGCSTAAAVNVSAGTVNFENVTFSSNTARAVNTTGGNLRFNKCSFTSNSATGDGGGAIFCGNGSYNPIIYLNACIFTDNTGGKNGYAIFINTTQSASNYASLCVNNSYFNNTSNINNQNGSLVTNKGKTLIINSTLVAQNNNKWGIYALGVHTVFKDNKGCLLLNDIIKNTSTSSTLSIYEAKSSNYYGIFKHSLARLGFADGTTDAQKAMYTTGGLASDSDVTLLGYTWNGTTPEGFTKQSKQQIMDELQLKDGSNDVYKLAADFITWLESIKYKISATEYNALDVDIEGRPRNTSAYWPGCYQND